MGKDLGGIAIVSLKDSHSLMPHKLLLNEATDFMLHAWADEKSSAFYKEVLACSMQTEGFIPQFYFALTNTSDTESPQKNANNIESCFTESCHAEFHLAESHLVSATTQKESAQEQEKMQSPKARKKAQKQSTQKIIACCGIALNDFVSRADLYPFLIALYVDEAHRNKGIARNLIEHAKQACKDSGFSALYCCTDICGFYEKFGFVFFGMAHDIFGYNNRIYRCNI